jgi:hypothetical protein
MNADFNLSNLFFEQSGLVAGASTSLAMQFMIDSDDVEIERVSVLLPSDSFILLD